MPENRPIQQAQQLLTDLHSRADHLSPEDLRSVLAAVHTLLTEAAHEPDALRQQLQAHIDKQASFNSLMVHELRKPMTSIRGYADMLAKPGLVAPEMQQQFIDTIRTNIIRMEGLVSDISDMNKLSAGQLRLESKPMLFKQVVLEARKQLDPLVDEFGHTAAFEVPDGLPLLNGDSKQLAKILTHLGRNAIQYTPKGGQFVLHAERLEGNRLLVSIQDNGIGMSAQDVARLGEPFFRGDHELVYSQKGYGLGIPVSLGLLALMGSKLDVRSEPGQGSTFSFMLIGM